MNIIFKLDINSGNAALVDNPTFEVPRLLHEVARAVASGRDGGVMFDSNGNAVGDWFMDIEKEGDD